MACEVSNDAHNANDGLSLTGDLSMLGILPQEHLTVFQNMASFRNMLVHRYENIDDELVFGIFKKRLEDFDLFMVLIMDWAGQTLLRKIHAANIT